MARLCCHSPFFSSNALTPSSRGLSMSLRQIKARYVLQLIVML
uniref:Uncharacterized protein n=1 Tax=Anguilla anguilla TaxID=7936 RepID=A0A0E9PDL3_ANGAN